MEQYTISELIKELNKIKSEHGGDTLVKIHLQSCEDVNGGDCSHDDFSLHVEKISELDADTQILKKRKIKVLSIYGGDLCPEDYKKDCK